MYASRRKTACHRPLVRRRHIRPLGSAVRRHDGYRGLVHELARRFVGYIGMIDIETTGRKAAASSRSVPKAFITTTRRKYCGEKDVGFPGDASIQIVFHENQPHRELLRPAYRDGGAPEAGVKLLVDAPPVGAPWPDGKRVSTAWARRTKAEIEAAFARSRMSGFRCRTAAVSPRGCGCRRGPRPCRSWRSSNISPTAIATLFA